MINIDVLLQSNRENHYKLLTLVGNEEYHKHILIKYLKTMGWRVYDVEKVVLDLVQILPKDKISHRIGTKLKEWVLGLENQVVLINTSILYSPELKLIDPVETFRYPMRGKKEAVIFIDGKIRDDKVIYSSPDKEDYAVVDLSKVISYRLTKVKVGD